MAKERSIKDIFIHLLIVTVLGVGAVLFFFYVYLPNTTNHGETITVPDLRGMSVNDLESFLNSKHLRFEVTEDSGYSAKEPPLSVLKQVPAPDSKVKENRKIYVTINAEKAPLIRMPKLSGGSVKNATLILQTYDLELGEIIYVPDRDLNYVLKQQLNGREVFEGEKIPKGSKIDLVAGDGLGRQNLQSPNLIGQDIESAQIAIIGSGLKVGDIIYETVNKTVTEGVLEDGTIGMQEIDVAIGSVRKQNPPAGQTIRLGRKIDLWVYQPDSVANTETPNLLDTEE